MLAKIAQCLTVSTSSASCPAVAVLPVLSSSTNRWEISWGLGSWRSFNCATFVCFYCQLFVCSGCRHCNQLGGRTASRQEERSIRVLLCQRHCPCHPWTAQVPPGNFPFSVVVLKTFNIKKQLAFHSGSCTLTLTSTTGMEWRRRSTPRTASWRCPSTSTESTSLEQATSGVIAFYYYYF